jgi:hypothetical protein
VNVNGEPDILRDFVRGERDWEDLTALGARLSFDTDGLHLDEPADAPVYEPSIGEVAAGLMCHWAVGTTLRDWARIVLATGMLELSGLEDQSEGDLLLEAIWDAAQGTEISALQLDVARRLAATT